jgi:hypothetical protein
MLEKKSDADVRGEGHPEAGGDPSAHFRLVFPRPSATLGDPRRDGMAASSAAAPYAAMQRLIGSGAGRRPPPEAEREGRR